MFEDVEHGTMYAGINSYETSLSFSFYDLRIIAIYVSMKRFSSFINI